MAFQEQTITDRVDLINKLETFATVQAGWFSAANGLFKARNTDTRTFTLIEDEDVGVSLDNLTMDKFILSLDVSVNDYERAMMNLIDGYHRVWFKGASTPEPWLMVIIENPVGIFHWMGFGFLESYGEGDIPFIFGSCRDQSITGGGLEDYIESDSDNAWRSGILNDFEAADEVNFPGGVYWNAGFHSCGGRYADIPRPTKFAGGGIPGVLTGTQRMLTKNLVNTSLNIFKLRVWTQDDGGTRKRFVGEVPIYFANMHGISGNTSLDVAGSPFRFYPLGYRSNAADGHSIVYVTGEWGFAVKED